LKILLMLAHSIEEYMQVKLLTELGHDVFSIGAYIDPRNPGDDKRPALPEAPFHEDLARVVWDTPAPNGDSLWAAKQNLPQAVIDWADVIICHHVEWEWLLGNWPRIRDKRVIWRTVGQSTHENELRMTPLRNDGLQIVRYSPKEKAIPYYAGEDALIRFWMDPAEFTDWTGEERVVGNITQSMVERGSWTGLAWFKEATDGLPVKPAGKGSEALGGVGGLEYDAMKAYLRRIRCYLYTGTFPASVTLGFIEALMTGVPVVAAGPERWRASFGALPYGHLLYEAHEIAPLWSDNPWEAGMMLRRLLADEEWAKAVSVRGQETAEAMFGKAKIAAQWKEFLG